MVGLAVAALVVLLVIAAVLAFLGNAAVQLVLIARERRVAHRR